MNVASTCSPDRSNPTQLQGKTQNVRLSDGRLSDGRMGRRLRWASPSLASLVVCVASACGARTVDDESGTVTDALTTTADQADAGTQPAAATNPKGTPDTATGGDTGAPSTTNVLPTGAPTTGSTFNGRCDSTSAIGSTNPPSTAGSTDSNTVSVDFTSTAVSVDFTSTSVPPISTGAGTEGSTSGNTGGVAAGCSTNWCWEDSVAANDVFYTISRDGKYASATKGVVFAWPDTYLPTAPTGGSGFVEANGNEVWLGNSDGLFRFDGEWAHSSTVPVLGLSQSAGGATWVLFDSEEAPLQRLVDGQWVTESLPEGTHGLDLIAIDEDTVWVVAGTAASQWRGGIHTGELTLYEVTARGVTVVSDTTETLLATPRFSRAGERVYLHDNGGLTQEVYDPLNWHVQAVKPANALGLYGTPDGRLLTNTWPELTTFNERVSESVYGQLCSDLVTLDHESMLCAAYHGGLVRLSAQRLR
jgi:hypothetical protein